MTGLASFVINGQIYCYEADYQNDTHRIFSNHNVQPLIEKLRHVIHNENPARRHYLQFYNDSRAIEFHVRPVPSVSLDEVILEDIDTFSESRKSHQQYGFSDFLQFMSGLFERNQKTVVIATTNYLKFLDDAIATRPVRFNRRYEFKLPGDHELERLFAQFFPDYSPGAELLAAAAASPAPISPRSNAPPRSSNTNTAAPLQKSLTKPSKSSVASSTPTLKAPAFDNKSPYPSSSIIPTPTNVPPYLIISPKKNSPPAPAQRGI